MSEERNTLGYAPLPPWYRRPRTWRWFRVGCALALMALILHWRNEIGRYAHRQYKITAIYLAQRECLREQMPEGTIVYDESNLPAPLLRGNELALKPEDPRPLRRLPPSWTPFESAMTALYPLPPPRRGTQIYVGSEKGLYRDVTPPEAVVFLHELKNSAGERRLVCVAAEPNRLVCHSWIPGTLLTPAISAQMDSMYWIRRGGGGGLRLEAGQVDPKNPARFVFFAEFHGQRRRVAGELGTDGRVRLSGFGWFLDGSPSNGHWDLCGWDYDEHEYVLHDAVTAELRLRTQLGTVATAFRDADTLFSVSHDFLETWSLAKQLRLSQCPLPPPLYSREWRYFEFSPDRRHLCLWDYGYDCCLVDTESGRTTRIAKRGSYVAFTRDSRVLAAIGRNVVERWDANTGEYLDPIREKRWGYPYLRGAFPVVLPPPAGNAPQRSEAPLHAAFSPKGDRVAAPASYDHRTSTVVVYDDETGHRTHRRTVSWGGDVGTGAWTPVWSPDGRWLAYGAHESAYLWRPEAGSPTYRLPLASPPLHDVGVTSVAFSPEGGKVAVANETDSEVRIWRLDEEGRPATQTLPPQP